MEAGWFRNLARVLDAPLPRRAAARVLTRFGLAGSVVLLGAASSAAAGNDKKQKQDKKDKPKKKPKFNEFGCVNVGQFCLKNSHCCSGICRGDKGKKTCEGHNTGFTSCTAEDLGFCAEADGGLILAAVCTTSLDEDGLCTTTTGNAPYCAATSPEVSCAPRKTLCNKDADCRPFCGPDAACLLCPGCAANSPKVTRACAGPAPDSCVF